MFLLELPHDLAEELKSLMLNLGKPHLLTYLQGEKVVTRRVRINHISEYGLAGWFLYDYGRTSLEMFNIQLDRVQWLEKEEK